MTDVDFDFFEAWSSLQAGVRPSLSAMRRNRVFAVTDTAVCSRPTGAIVLVDISWRLGISRPAVLAAVLQDLLFSLLFYRTAISAPQRLESARMYVPVYIS